MAETPKRARQVSLFAVWSGDESIQKKSKVEIPEWKKIGKGTSLKEDDSYRQERVDAGLPYVKRGSRDALGNERTGGAVGGRPKKEGLQKAGTFGGGTSNRLKAGDERRRKEYSAPEKLQIIEQIEEDRKEKFGDEDVKLKWYEEQAFWKEMYEKFPHVCVNMKALSKLCDTKMELKARCAKLQLGKGIYGRTLGWRNGLKGSVLKHSSNNKGCRRQGGGRKTKFMEFQQQVKAFSGVERLLGHQLEPVDLFYEFLDQVDKRIMLFELKKEFTELPVKEELWLKELQSRSKKLRASAKYQQSFTRRLVSFCEMQRYKPQRFTLLSDAEEKIRCHCSWQMFDRLIWLVSYGSELELKKFIAKAADFIVNRKKTAIFMGDQIPFWIKIGSRLALYKRWETDTKEGRRLRKNIDDPTIRYPTQKLAGLEDIEKIEKKKSKDTHTQLRGPTNVDQDKCRVCLEARQVITDYFNPDEDPKGFILPSLLVVHGAHARLSNISPEHKWIKDEKFRVGGVEVHHKAGHGTVCLKEYVELRKLYPEIFEDLIVMSQPVACVDEIIYIWNLEDLRERYPQFLSQRDLLGVAFTEVSKLAHRAGSFINSWVGAGMTPVLQLTDTDLAFIMKAASRDEKTNLVLEMKQKAQDEGGISSAPDFKCGPYEMVKIAHAGHKAMVAHNEKSNLVLAGMRRNGFLHWRPDGEGKLVLSELQDWCKQPGTDVVKLVEGSHRLKPSWLEGRGEWLDSAGRPIKEDWSRSIAVKEENAHGEPEEMKEFMESVVEDKFTVDYKVRLGGKDITIPVVDLGFANEELFAEVVRIGVLKTPKMRRSERRRDFEEKLGSLKKITNVNKGRGMKKLKVEYAMKELDIHWHAGLDEDLKEKTVKEIFSLLMPSAGGNRGDKNKRIRFQSRNLKKDH